jgi:hypothetical protein
MASLQRLSRWITVERVAAWTLAVLLVAGSVGLWYVATPFHAPSDSLSTVRADADVTVTATDAGYVLAPTQTVGTEATGSASTDPLGETGLVFYPGARVHPDAYVPVLAPLVAASGLTVVIPHPPLNLALLDTGAAGRVIETSEAGPSDRFAGDAGLFDPERPLAAPSTVERWYVGGHSLGGVAACRFADAHSDRVAGVVLFASYCDRDVSDTNLRLLSVTGTTDGVLDRTAYREARDRLPPTTTQTVSLDGVNHTQFGAYRGQRGDRPGTVSYERAHAELRVTLVEFLTAN